MSSVFCVHFSQLVDHLCDIGIDMVTLFEHTRVKILLSAIERQVSKGDTNNEVVGYYCNLGYTSK
jgi:hypothetical protein